ncbi:hypothetical protein E2542_SST22357 [Spatholobus suberectus]|nr:hypothetical protein E2542_SST22357 [Spatholobus suberectus]
MAFTAWLRCAIFDSTFFVSLKHSSLCLAIATPHSARLLPKMPRKRSPIFHKVSLHLLRLSLLMHKLRKPVIPKLILFLKTFRKREEFKLHRHYNYGEYQFSTSSTPLINNRYHRNQFKNRGRRGLCSFLYLYWCLGNLKVEGGGECQLSPFEIEVAEDLFGETGSGDEGESVDQKAERFIQSFYQQMRMQRQESL